MITVAASVGQTKIGAGAIDSAGNIVCQVGEVATPKGLEERYEAIADQVVRVVDEVGEASLIRVGISYPEMMEPPVRMISNSELLTRRDNPYSDGIISRLRKSLDDLHAVELLPIELLHDAAAAVLGEVSSKGTLPGYKDCLFIVWGTGVASGVVSDGSLYWFDPMVGLMVGEIGLQVIRRANDVYEYRPSAGMPNVDDDELRLDRRMRGPEVVRRMRNSIERDHRGAALTSILKKRAEAVELVDMNRAAKLGDQFAVELIADAGREMGRSLVPFVHYWLHERQMTFARQIVIGSGVAKLGAGVMKNGEEVLISAIRDAMDDGLWSLGVEDFDTAGVVLSAIGYEREFFGFL